jgi:hypothetical protein
VASPLNALAIRRRLGRTDWAAPLAFGPDGWGFQHRTVHGSVLITCADHDGEEWIHASIAWDGHMPTYADLKHLHGAVFADRWAYQVFAPPSDHVNIHRHALHLFGRLDGKAALPDFTEGTGSI